MIGVCFQPEPVRWALAVLDLRSAQALTTMDFDLFGSAVHLQDPGKWKTQ
jgi:hypothetical protein